MDWKRLDAKEIKANVTINGTEILVHYKADKEDQTKALISDFESNLVLLGEMKVGYDQSVTDIKKLDDEEKTLNERLHQLRKERKQHKENSIMFRDGYDETKEKVTKVFKDNQKGLFRGTSLKELGLADNLPKVGNVMGKRGNQGKYEDSMKAEWSEIMRDPKNTYKKALEIINKRYAHKKNLEGELIHFNTISSIRGVVEPWEIKMGMRPERAPRKKQPSRSSKKK